VIDIERLKELEGYATNCAECGLYGLDTCYNCRKGRVTNSEVLEIIEELIKWKVMKSLF